MKTITTREVALPGSKKASTLKLYEDRINKADQDAWMARIDTGLVLAAIKDGELYRDIGFKSFAEYVDTPLVDSTGAKSYRFIFFSKEANRRIDQSISYQLLQKYREEKNLALPLPENAFQMRAITRLPHARQAPLYFQAVEHAQKCAVAPTEEFLRVFLDKGVRNGDSPETIASEPIDEMDDVVFAEAPIQKRYQPDAAKALERIDRFSEQNIFPEQASKAIRDGFINIIDEDLGMWGRMPDEDFVPVGRMLFRLQDKINFTAARRFQSKCKDPKFLDPIVLYAIKEGSSVIVNHDGFQIQIRPLPPK
jgi:hypothetical protein